jgi:hypothetical protein
MAHGQTINGTPTDNQWHTDRQSMAHRQTINGTRTDNQWHTDRQSMAHAHRDDIKIYMLEIFSFQKAKRQAI